jgi:RNA polymerase sigma factor (sigma-70 family)
MEASALRQTTRAPRLAGISPYLRLQRDERLVALVRRGNAAAFEVLVRRYQARLLAFCRGMLGSTEDAEDVLQEVFASAYKALLADERPINARPWLYRIARNRCLNHLRGAKAAGVDSMDVFEHDNGATTAETVQRREELRLIVADVQRLPESQRGALLLREMESLSYDQIALAMDTTVPAVKSLLVRARVSLAEANEARSLTCDEVRLELGRVEEGLAKLSAPVRRHVKSCERCRHFRVELRRTTRALAAAYPVPVLLLLKNLLAGKLLGGAGGAGAAGVGGGAATGGAGAATGGALTASLAPLAVKGAAGLAATAALTAGAIEVDHLRERDSERARAVVSEPVERPAPDASADRAAAPEAPSAQQQGRRERDRHDRRASRERTKPDRRAHDGGPGAGGGNGSAAAPAGSAPVDPYTGEPVEPAPEVDPYTARPAPREQRAEDARSSEPEGRNGGAAELLRELAPAGE